MKVSVCFQFEIFPILMLPAHFCSKLIYLSRCGHPKVLDVTHFTSPDGAALSLVEVLGPAGTSWLATEGHCERILSWKKQIIGSFGCI